MASEIVSFSAGNLPAHLRAKGELSDTAKALMGTPGSKRISIRNGVWRLLDGGKEITQVEERYLDVVIIKAAPKVARVFYAKTFDKDSADVPDCWSGDGDTPDRSVKQPQGVTCAKCPQNVAGSGKGDSRACRFQQRIAVVTLGNLMESVEEGMEPDVLQFTVPATSLFGKADGEKRPLQDYARWLVAQKVSPEMLVTRMRFDTSDGAEAVKVWFKPMRWLDQAEFDLVERTAAGPDALRAVTMSVYQADNDAPRTAIASEVEGAPPVKKAKPAVEDDGAPAPKARAKAKPAAEDDDEAPAPKTKAKPAAEDDEDEAPAPKTKARAKAKPAVEDDEDEAPAPKTKAKPAVEDDEDEAPPTRRAAPVKPAPSENVRKDAAALVDEWDD